MNAQHRAYERRPRKPEAADGRIQWLEPFLLAWGRWAVSVDDGGRGWPRQVPWVGLHITTNVHESKEPVMIWGHDIRDINRIDSAINLLGPHPRLVVATFYKLQGSRNKCADLLHCSRRLVTETVATAHVKIAAEFVRPVDSTRLSDQYSA